MWVRVARIGKPSGLLGRVTVQVTTDEPDRRLRPGAVLARDDTGADPLTVRWSGRMGSRWLLAFEHVTDRTAAEELRGDELFAQADDTGPQDPDDFYDWQLVGLPCTLPDGTPLGRVARVQHAPAQDLLLVGPPGGPLAQVPFVAGIVREVTAAGMVLDPPAGLLDPDLAVPEEPP